MKNKRILPEKTASFERLDQNVEDASSREAAKIYTTMFWFTCAYCGPFLPLMDWNFVRDELKKIVSRRTDRQTHKSTLETKTDENL